MQRPLSVQNRVLLSCGVDSLQQQQQPIVQNTIDFSVESKHFSFSGKSWGRSISRFEWANNSPSRIIVIEEVGFASGEKRVTPIGRTHSFTHSVASQEKKLASSNCAMLMKHADAWLTNGYICIEKRKYCRTSDYSDVTHHSSSTTIQIAATIQAGTLQHLFAWLSSVGNKHRYKRLGPADRGRPAIEPTY